MSNLKEVAKLAGVSVMTVSNVLRGSVPVSNALKARVQRAVEALDYHPNHIARSLKTKQTKTLGIVIPDITISFFPQIVQGAEHAARAQGYTLITVNTEEDFERESQALALLRSQKVDGILLVVASGTQSFVHVENARRARVPLVCLDRIPASLPVDSVCADNVDGAQRCVSHLIERGHDQMAILMGSPQLDNERERLHGYRRALKAAKLPFRPELVWQAGFSDEEASRLCEGKLKTTRPKPSALFTTNGIMAIAALEALYRLRLRCPEDVALATFDELTSIRLFEPRITTVIQPAHEIGWQGAELLICRIKDQDWDATPVKMRLPTKLHVADSSRLAQPSISESRLGVP